MKPAEYEKFVGEHFKKLGYTVEINGKSGDYGLDVLASKGKQKIAIQAKMFGGTSRKVNRQVIMELYGVKDYFDCTKAVLATNGTVLTDATEVANKLGIEILYIKGETSVSNKNESSLNNFDTIWSKYIMPLEGKSLIKNDGKLNKIKKVDWGGIERITSNGKAGKIDIEIFKLTINKLLADGYVTRDEINQNYSKRASSGVVLILSQVPFFELVYNPVALRYSI